MKKTKDTNLKLKKAVNRLLFRKKKEDPPTRESLMHQFKNIILTNKQLNQRSMNFNFNKEYKRMHKTMNRFNSEQNSKKNLVSKLSKENQFFTKSYSNIIASLVIKLDKKNINYKTITNFNQKYEPLENSKKKDNNLFFEDPLLLTKSKDLDNYYDNEKNINKEDEYLNYSRKILFGIDINSPLNRVLQIIEKRNAMTPMVSPQEENLESEGNASERNNFNKKNTNENNQPLSDRNKNYFRNKTSKLFYNKFTDVNKMNEKEEIKKLKKYNRSIKKLIYQDQPDRTYTDKNIKKFSLYLNNNNINSENKNDNILKTYTNKSKNYLGIKFNSNFSSKNVMNTIMVNNLENIKPKKKKLIKINQEKNDNYIKEFENMYPIQGKMQKTLKKKLLKMKKLKGSIQIQSIYKDLAKTKESLNEYAKEKEPKFKYLYSIFSKKKFNPFQKEEKENYRIKRLDHELFWTVNEFHNN